MDKKVVKPVGAEPDLDLGKDYKKVVVKHKNGFNDDKDVDFGGNDKAFGDKDKPFDGKWHRFWW